MVDSLTLKVEDDDADDTLKEDLEHGYEDDHFIIDSARTVVKNDTVLEVSNEPDNKYLLPEE